MINQYNRRYYLHKRLKDKIHVSSHNKKIYISKESIEEYPKKTQSYIQELRYKYGYSIQYNLL